MDFAPKVEIVRELFLEYSRQLGVQLCLAEFQKELDQPDAKYQRLVVAFDGGHAAGCAALRQLEPGIAEMKRLYVRPAYRGTGLGRRLTIAVVDEARRLGSGAMRLDTLSSMESAIGLYRSLGFREIPAYHEGSLPGLLFFELKL